MSVAAFNQNNFTTQDPTTYKTALDGNVSVFRRIGDDFAPHAQSTPNMTVALDAGHIFNGSALTEVAAQSTGTITGPVTYSRIDRVVIDSLAGAVSVITGTEAASPVPPALTVGTLPVAQILLAVGVTAITNSMLTDERDLTRKGMTSGAQVTVATAATTGIVAAKSTNLIFSGSTTITSFGASGTAGTIYRCRLTGAPLITYNGSNLITPGNANIQGAAGDTFDLEDLGSASWRIREYYPASGRPVASKSPTRQYLTSGTTYTTPAGATKIRIYEVGAGGGGGGFGSGTNGGVGGDTNFNGTVAKGGGYGAAGIGGAPGAGGTGGSNGSAGSVFRQQGGQGFLMVGSATPGGSSRLGPGAGNNGAAPQSALPNSGGGGAGGGSSSTSTTSAGPGGGGEYAEFEIVSPASSYTYAIGPGGAAGTGSTSAGGAGGSGFIIVDEFYT